MAIHGSVEAAIGYEMGLSSLQVTAVLRAEADNAVSDAQAAWSQCMLEMTGRTFEHFTLARQYAYQHPGAAAATAAADAACTGGTRLRYVFLHALQQATAKLIDEHLGLVEEYQRAIGEAINRATSLVGG